jgi:hypothetical protein
MKVAIYAGTIIMLGIGYGLTCSKRSGANERGDRVAILPTCGAILMFAALTLYSLLLT